MFNKKSYERFIVSIVQFEQHHIVLLELLCGCVGASVSGIVLDAANEITI